MIPYGLQCCVLGFVDPLLCKILRFIVLTTTALFIFLFPGETMAVEVTLVVAIVEGVIILCGLLVFVWFNCWNGRRRW